MNTSEANYAAICSTHTYADRVETVGVAQAAGLSPCSGAIFGMGETDEDIVDLAMHLRKLDPDSVPINFLIPFEGTPLGDRPAEDPLELVRTIATARILMPRSFVRLSAGRMSLSPEGQALCFMAGANSVFLGEQLLTTPNPSADTDRRLFADLGLQLQEAPRA